MADYTIVNGSDEQLANVNAGGTDVDAYSYKNGVTLSDAELATLLDGTSFGQKNVAVFADQTGEPEAEAVAHKRVIQLGAFTASA
jgi:hypothetical protein